MESTIRLVMISITVLATRLPPTISQSTPPIAPWTDQLTSGRAGNPGAQIHLSSRVITTVTSYALEAITVAIRNLTIPDITFPVFFDTLTIKQFRITDAKFSNYENKFMEPNRIQTRFYGGRVAAQGIWRYKPAGDEPAKSGTFRATVVNAEIRLLNQLARTSDAKPTLQTIECKPNFRQFRADIEGAPPGMSVIENCTNPLCNKIRGQFEDMICAIVRNYIRDTINRPLSSFPARIKLNCTSQFFLDYGLLNTEPKVITATQSIRSGSEGRVLYRNTTSGFPFWPHDFQQFSNRSMFTFDFGDFVFNTLFHQAHSQSYRFSAIDHIAQSSTAFYDLLKFKCQGRLCLGSIFKNEFTNQYSPNAIGDLVLKTSSRSIRLFIQENRAGNYDGSSSSLEIYGPPDSSNNRRLLTKLDIRLLRGDFVPAWKVNRITGSVKLTHLQFNQPSIPISTLDRDWAIKLVQIASPILNEVFNNFLSRNALFPIPMLDGFDCVSPIFSILPRSVRIECDVRSTRIQRYSARRSC